MRSHSSLVLAIAACSYEPLASLPPEPDAAEPDAGLVCDARYNIVLPGIAPSRYYIEGGARAWRAAEDACEATGGHLFAPGSDAEVNALRTILDGNKGWVGIVQLEGQAQPIDNWFQITGEAATMQWQPSKPDDGGSENGGEQTGAINDLGLDDENETQMRYSICECDGRPPDPVLVNLFPAS